jgi:nitrogen fixation/metabolism regulation signal transduction histidine kinase
MTRQSGWRRILRALPLLAVLAVLLSALYLVSSVEQESTQLGRMTLWVFVLTAVALAALIVVIVGRLIRLIRRLRRAEPGARLTARLVAVFIALALPPVVILYLFALEFLNETIEGWLDVQVESALSDSIELGQLFIDLRTREVSDQLRALAQRIDPEDEDDAFDRFLAQVSAAGPVELSIVDASGRSSVFVHIDPSQLIADRPSSFALSQALEAGQYAAAERRGDRFAIRALVELEGSRFGASRYLLQGVYPLPEDFGALADGIEQAYYRYLNVSFLRERLQQSLVLILTLVLMLTALLAMLVAFNAARRLSQPIRDLAQATGEVAAGRFPDELTVSSRDELGFLVGSFNVMTRELAASRQALEAQRRYLEIVLGRLSAGVLAIDGEGRISALNESAERILDLADRQGQSLQRVRAERPDLAGLLDILIERSGVPGGDWRQEIQLGLPDRPLVLVCRGSDLPQEIGGQVVVFDDVTILDQAQREAAWAEVARRLAHEVKNPLTPIQLAAERLKYKLDPVLEAPEQALLERATTTIRAQVDTLKRLVDAFGDYARPVRLRLEPVDLAALVQEVADLYASGDQPIEFELQVAPDTPRVQADQASLRRVLLNLVRNAQEAHPQGCPVISISLAPEDNESTAGVRWRVADNGPGFAPDVIERIFEPYVTTKDRGTGLGLAIVRRIVEEHGGSIELGNIEGGAEVRIWLSAVEARTPADPESPVQ